MNRRDNDDFKNLQKIWYNKLRDTGFIDIETADPFLEQRLKIEHRRFFSKQNKHIGDRSVYAWREPALEAKIKYYLDLTHLVNDPKTYFRNDMDRIVMVMHSDGYRFPEIVRFLAAFGYKRKKRSIRYLIRRYEHLWGLRTYSPKQLNRKPRKNKHLMI